MSTVSSISPTSDSSSGSSLTLTSMEGCSRRAAEVEAELSSTVFLGSETVVAAAFTIPCTFGLTYRFRRAFTSGAVDGTIVHVWYSGVLCHLALCLAILYVSLLHRVANLSSLLPRSEISKHCIQKYFSALAVLSGFLLSGSFCFFSGIGALVSLAQPLFQSHTNCRFEHVALLLLPSDSELSSMVMSCSTTKGTVFPVLVIANECQKNSTIITLFQCLSVKINSIQ